MRLLEKIPIESISIFPDIGLVVCPVGTNAMYQYIYRTATGIRWNDECAGFVAYEPERWAYPDLLRNVYMSVASELGIRLVPDENTSWDPSLGKELHDLHKRLPA